MKNASPSGQAAEPEDGQAKTEWQALLPAVPGFNIPFAFVVHPGLLMIGDIADTLHRVGTAN